VNAYFLTSGLNAAYYPNRWFAGTPALSIREPQVNADWGDGEIIPGVASDYVSVEWTGWLNPTYTEAFTFIVRSNDGVRLTIGDTVLIDRLDRVIADGESLTSTSAPVQLTASSFVPIKVQYYDVSGDAHIILEWRSASQAQEVIPASRFYAPAAGALPLTGSTVSSSAIFSPMQTTSVAQGDSSTYAANSLTISWSAPADFGCSAITGYSISIDNAGAVTTSTVGAVTTTTLTILTPGAPVAITVTAVNSVGSGVASTPVTLTPATLPSAPASISVVALGKSAITLEWPVPSDTGIGDTSIAISMYHLWVDEGYGDGFTLLSDQASRTYAHSGLIAGQELAYRVSASNFMGEVPFSSEYRFRSMVVPAKPSSAPRNVPTLTTQTAIHIEYDQVEDDGGSLILNYNIYIDDGNGGAFGAAINNGLSLSYDTSALSLTAGLTYRFKYSAVNSQGEGPLSDGVAILLAEAPAAPQNLARADVETLSAGVIRITWGEPAGNGGSVVSGYKVYRDGKLSYEASNTEFTFTFYDLSVGTTYTIGVSAVNAVTEGPRSELALLAASVPSKMSRPTRKTSSPTTIEVQWTVPSFDGGSAVTQYRVRRDDGPSTSFLSDTTTTSLSNQFTGLLNSVLAYRVQVAAENSLGVGEWSDPVTFYAASAPGAPASLTVISQSTTQISLGWSKPASDGGCQIEGYRLWMEDVRNPGLKLIFDGSTRSAVLKYSVISPTISASTTYRFAVAAVA